MLCNWKKIKWQLTVNMPLVLDMLMEICGQKKGLITAKESQIKYQEEILQILDVIWKLRMIDD